MLDGDPGERVDVGAGISEVAAISELDMGVEALLGSKTSDWVAVVVEPRDSISPRAEMKTDGRDDTGAGPADEPGRTELKIRTFMIVVDSGSGDNCGEGAAELPKDKLGSTVFDTRAPLVAVEANENGKDGIVIAAKLENCELELLLIELEEFGLENETVEAAAKSVVGAAGGGLMSPKPPH